MPKDVTLSAGEGSASTPGREDSAFDDPSSSTDPQVFPVDGDLDASTAMRLKPLILAHIECHGPNLWLDVSTVSFVDSTGLGLLVGILQHARHLQGSVLLINPNRQLSRILQVTGLESLFAIRHE